MNLKMSKERSVEGVEGEKGETTQYNYTLSKSQDEGKRHKTGTLTFYRMSLHHSSSRGEQRYSGRKFLKSINFKCLYFINVFPNS